MPESKHGRRTTGSDAATSRQYQVAVLVDRLLSRGLTAKGFLVMAGPGPTAVTLKFGLHTLLLALGAGN